MEKDYVDPWSLNSRDGVFLVRIARKAVEKYLKEKAIINPPPDTPSILYKRGAAFVTIMTYYSYESRELRGCIGHVVPVKELIRSVIEVSIEAAVNDPRFPPMNINELERVTFEVSVLGRLEPLPRDPGKRINSFKIGRHGLVAKRGFMQGLLLPDVPLEYLWDNETFLAETCLKAGMEPTCWLDENTEFYRYSARVWREKSPLGEVEERLLEKEYEELIKNASTKRKGV